MKRVVYFWKRQNLKTKFLLIAIPSAVFSSIIIMAAALFIFRAYEKNMYGMTVQNMNMIIRHIETQLSEVDKLSMNIIVDPAVQKALKSDKPNVRTKEVSMESLRLAQNMYEVMQEQLRSNSTIVSVSIFVEDEWYYAGNSRRSLDSSILPEIEKQLPENSSEILWYAKGYPADSLYGARSVKDLYYHTFEDEALLVIEYDLKGSIQNFLRDNNNVPYAPGLAVFDRENCLYSDLENIPGEHIFKAKSSGYGTTSVDGHKYFTAFLDNSDYGWTYVFFILYDNLFGAMRFLKYFFLIMAAAMIVISVLYCEKLTAVITDRFTHLSRRMRTVQEGNFRTEAVTGPSQGDELEVVCEEFEEMVGRVDQLIQENYVKQMLIHENQLKVLQNQINPHFLFNTLQTISWKAREGHQETISYITEALGKLLRYTLREDNDPAFLEDEVDILMRYITIQKTRYEERLLVDIDIPESAKRQKVPKLVLQSLVENSIKYALEAMLEPCHIQISVLDEKSVLRILVRDNGPGIDPAVLDAVPTNDENRTGCGIGLINIRRRLKLLFGEESELLLYSIPPDGMDGESPDLPPDISHSDSARPQHGTLVEVRIVKERSC